MQKVMQNTRYDEKNAWNNLKHVQNCMFQGEIFQFRSIFKL